MTDSLGSRVATFEADVSIVHQITHGDSNTVVQTEGGPVRSVAKLIADNQIELNQAYPDAGALQDADTVHMGRSGVFDTTWGKVKAYVLSAISNGTSPDAGALQDSDAVPMGRSGLLQTNWGKVKAYVLSAIANGTSTDAGALTGAEIAPVSRGSGALQTTLTKIAQWTTQTYQGFQQSGAGAIASTVFGQFSKQLYLSDFDNSADAVSAALSQRLIVPFGASVTVNVPATCATIQAALSAIAGWEIYGAATIKVADGTYAVATTIGFSHPFGQNIHILGNVATPANCVLDFSAANTDGVNVATGAKLGEFNGFTVKGKGAIVAGAQNIHFGIYSYGGQISKLGPNLIVDGFYYGISALNGARIYADGTDATTNRVEVKNSGDVAFWVISGSFMSCVYAYAHGAADNTNGGNPLGGGFIAEFASGMVANNATAIGNLYCGFGVNSGSAMRAWNTTVTGNGHGVSANSMGAIEIFGSTIGGNTWYGYHSDGMGQVYGWNTITVSSANTLGDHKQPTEYDPNNGAWKNNTGSLTTTAGPESATGGAVYHDLNATGATSNYDILRALYNGAERGRLQYRPDFSLWEFIANSKTLVRLFDTGKVTVGRNNVATGDTAGHLQIPKVAGAPTGAITDVEGGYVPIVYDTTNHKLWIYDGSVWKGAAFA